MLLKVEAPTASPVEVTDRPGPTAAMTAQTPAPIATPINPPIIPMPIVSAMTWRTTSPRDQPIARSEPISRTRFATLERVSRPAIRNAASRTTMASTPPRSLASLWALLRLPLTESASDLDVSTVAPGSSALIALVTAATSEAFFTDTSTSFTYFGAEARLCIVDSGK